MFCGSHCDICCTEESTLSTEHVERSANSALHIRTLFACLDWWGRYVARVSIDEYPQKSFVLMSLCSQVDAITHSRARHFAYLNDFRRRET